MVAPGPLVGVFGAEPRVASIARDTLLVAAAMQVLDAVATVALGTLSGAGDTRFVMVLTVTATWFAKLPLAAALVVGLGLGAPGAWLGITLEIAVLALVAGLRVRGTRWLRA